MSISSGVISEGNNISVLVFVQKLKTFTESPPEDRVEKSGRNREHPRLFPGTRTHLKGVFILVPHHFKQVFLLRWLDL